jgi:hypothetical protein
MFARRFFVPTPRRAAMLAAFVLLLVATFAAPPARAQSGSLVAAASDVYRVLRIGSTVRDTLTADDDTISDGSHVRAYRLALREGQQVTVVLTSRALEGVLMVTLDDEERAADQSAGTSTRRFGVMRADADDDGVTHVHVTFTAPMTGAYMIGVDGMTEDSLGGFELSVAAGAAARTPVGRGSPPVPPSRPAIAQRA